MVALPKQFWEQRREAPASCCKISPQTHALSQHSTPWFCMFCYQCADSSDVCTGDGDSSCERSFTFWWFSRSKNLGLKSGYKLFVWRWCNQHQQTSCSMLFHYVCLLWLATCESQREGQIHLSFGWKRLAKSGTPWFSCQTLARLLAADSFASIIQAGHCISWHVCSQSFAHPQLDRMILMTLVVFIDWLDGTVRMRTPKFLPLNDWVLRCSRVLSWTWGSKVGFPCGSHEGSCKTQRHGQHVIADRQPDTYNNW